MKSLFQKWVLVLVPLLDDFIVLSLKDPFFFCKSNFYIGFCRCSKLSFWWLFFYNLRSSSYNVGFLSFFHELLMEFVKLNPFLLWVARIVIPPFEWWNLNGAGSFYTAVLDEASLLPGLIGILLKCTFEYMPLKL